MKKISDIPPLDRPRERLREKGATALSDWELMAVVLGSGTQKLNVGGLSKKIIDLIDSNKRTSDRFAEELLKITGVGWAKAARIIAAQEFFRRRTAESSTRISSPQDILPLISYLSNRKQEHFVSITLDGSGEIIANRIITVGLVNQAQVHPREVFSDAILDRATAIIVAHNHPSNSLQPSDSDIETTKRLKNAGELLGIKLLDHLIFNKLGYYSFLENELVFLDDK